MFLTQWLSITETRGCHREALSRKQLFYVLQNACWTKLTEVRAARTRKGKSGERGKVEKRNKRRQGRSEGIAGQREETGNGASFCSRFNGMERSCLLLLGRVVPHHSTYKSGLVIKLYDQPPSCSFISSLHFLFQLASPAVCSPLSSLSGETTCFGEAWIKRDDRQKPRKGKTKLRLGEWGWRGSGGFLALIQRTGHTRRFSF